MIAETALPYGNGRLTFALPDDAEVIQIPEIEARVSPEGFQADLAPFLEALPITGNIAVVVADKTRLCGYDRFLPVLLDEIVKRGASPNRITIYIAYGTHQPQSDAESQSAYGPVWGRFRFVPHDCTDGRFFRELGSTRRGTPVRLRKDILDAEYLITFGAVSHHYFAGYGGGRKLIFPGLGEQRAIYKNHGLFLERKNRCLSPGCLPGRLDGNPLAEDLAEVETHRPADLSIHGILDSHGRLCRLIIGQGIEAFQHACRLHGTHSEIKDDRTYDMVLASCGGFPKDINFIQSHKGIHNAATFVKKNGVLVVLAQCRDGVGSTTFLPWFDLNDRESAFDRLAADYQGNGGTALAMMEKVRRIKIFVVTELDALVCGRIGITPLSHESAFKQVKGHRGSLAVVPNAGYLVKAVRP